MSYDSWEVRDAVSIRSMSSGSEREGLCKKRSEEKLLTRNELDLRMGTFAFVETLESL